MKKHPKTSPPPAPPAPPEPATVSAASEDVPGFASLALPPRTLTTLAEIGFTVPTPIQLGAIPPLLEGRDLVGQARTGTGKTAAFGLPLITRLASGQRAPTPRGLVLTPTRELALQVTEALTTLARGTPLRFLTVYGGSAYGPQLRGLREGVDVVIGTPGRIIDLMERESLQLGAVEMVVLDEADEMLEMGFIEAVETILARTPEATRQVALFSATMPPPIRKVAERYLRDPVTIAETSQTVVAIEQRYVQVPPRFKREALLRILRSEVRGATLVFAATRASCAEAADFLATHGIPAEPLHGDLSQPARERVIELLRARRVEVVVATDIAARGIDIEHLTHIVNLDLPKNVETYTHRIGRTGRAGRKGRAITLVTPRESARFADALRRRGVALEELFIASEHALAMRQRELVAERLAELAAAPALADARAWIDTLVASGRDLAELAAGLALLVGDNVPMRFGEPLDRGLPPWARQPSAAAPAPQAKTERDRPAPPRAPKPAPPMNGDGRALVVVGVGREHAVRPADLVGALTNELGLTGRDIGRVELRDTSTLIEVPAAFVARLGDEAWPLTIRRIETTIRRHEPHEPRRTRQPAAPERASKHTPAPRPPPEHAHAPRRIQDHAHAPRRTQDHAPAPRRTQDHAPDPASPYAGRAPTTTRPPASSRTPAPARSSGPARSPAPARSSGPARSPAPARSSGPTRAPAATRTPTPAPGPTEPRRPSKRPPPSRSLADRPPRRAVDVAPRTPRTPRS